MEKEERKKSTIYLTVAAILVIVGTITFFKSGKQTDVSPQVATTAKDTIKPQEETTVARIDISTKLVNADKQPFEVYVDNAKEKEKIAYWMRNYGLQGYMLQGNEGAKNITVKALDDAEISIFLRGIWEKNDKGEVVEHWVKYTSLTVNGEDVLPEAVEVWHNKPFHYTINAKAGEEYKIHAEWTKADK